MFYHRLLLFYFRDVTIFANTAFYLISKKSSGFRGGAGLLRRSANHRHNIEHVSRMMCCCMAREIVRDLGTISFVDTIMGTTTTLSRYLFFTYFCLMLLLWKVEALLLSGLCRSIKIYRCQCIHIIRKITGYCLRFTSVNRTGSRDQLMLVCKLLMHH